MLTRWLTFTALLAASESPHRAAAGHSLLTIAPTCRVKGLPKVKLTLYCGDGKNRGLVQYWHTPFGDLQTPGFQSKLDPVFMHQDGSLVVLNSSHLHSGLYYCLLQHSEGSTLWPYELYITSDSQQNQEHDEYGSRSSSSHQSRVKRDAGSEEPEDSEEYEEAAVTEQQFAGAVAASVLLTFVVGFSTGALTRNLVLRCFRAAAAMLRSIRRKQCQLDRGPEVYMATLPNMYHNKASAIGQEQNDVTMETKSLPLTPPDKPRRSFRLKQEELEIAVYLEGCDYEEEGRGRQSQHENQKGCEEEKERGARGIYPLEDNEGSQESRDEMCGQEEGGGRSPEENQKWCEEEDKEEIKVRGFHLLGDNGGSQNKTDEERDNEDGESREEMKVSRHEEQEERREEGEERRVKEQEEEGTEEKVRDYEEGEEISRDSQQLSDTDDEVKGIKRVMKGAGPPSSPRSARRHRVIRLYQYDEEGQRYSHLPDPSPDDPAPAPRLKQRSLSLTRLSAIMAVASTGPLDRRETEGEDGEDGEGKPHFHMEI